MKVAIVTFAWSKNYGAALQAYALQSVLKGMDHDAFVVPINPERRRGMLRQFIGKGIRPTVRKIREWFLFRSFDAFRRAHYDFGGLQEGGYSHFIANCPQADVFVVGSDQVWNLSVMQSPLEEDFYFLKMCPDSAKRVAYAASWSMASISADAAERLKPLLERFSAISVREKSGVGILARMGIEAKWMPDPTMLLASREWTERLGIGILTANRIFAYQLQWESEHDCIGLAKRFGRTMHMEVCAPYPSGNAFLSPTDWVRTLASSRFVVTNSFHGVVFSVLFHVPFAVSLIAGRFSGMNERVTTLLDRLGLADRIIKSEDDVAALLASPIHWDEVDNQLAVWRNEAMEFLLRISRVEVEGGWN